MKVLRNTNLKTRNYILQVLKEVAQLRLYIDNQRLLSIQNNNYQHINYLILLQRH